jgi:exonuclease VII small subunit
MPTVYEKPVEQSLESRIARLEELVKRHETAIYRMDMELEKYKKIALF